MDDLVSLTKILFCLHAQGLAVRPDDVVKLTSVFVHSREWSQERKLRTLKALLARSEEENQIIDRLALSFFSGALDEPDASGSLLMTGRSASSEVRSAARRSSSDGMDFFGRKTLFRWRVVLGVMVSMSLFVTALSWFWTPLWSGNYLGEPLEPGKILEPIKDGAGWLNDNFIGIVFMALTLIFLAALGILRQGGNIRALMLSTGPRTYRLDIDTAAEVLDEGLLREAAFLLSAPSEKSISPWLNPVDTVEETVRCAGRIILRYGMHREHRPILVIEDVSLSMRRWSGQGSQLVSSLRRQGGDVGHYFTEGVPLNVFDDQNTRRSVALSQLLERFGNGKLIVITDARRLGYEFRGEFPAWLEGPLKKAIWFHPQEPELWEGGARWLSKLVYYVPLTDEGLKLLGRSSVDFSGQVRWFPPEVPKGCSSAVRLLALRHALGEGAFWWLSAGAVLDYIDGLTMRTWWALRASGIVASPLKNVQRALSIPEVTVGGDGGVTIQEDFRGELLENLAFENRGLLSRVVGWAEVLIAQDIERLPATSLAHIAARAAKVKLQLICPERSKEGLRNRQAMVVDGYGAWLGNFGSAFSISGDTTFNVGVPGRGQSGKSILSRLSVYALRKVSEAWLLFLDLGRFILSDALLFLRRERWLQQRELTMILFAVLCLGGGLITYTWVQLEGLRLGYEINSLEKRLGDLVRKERMLRVESGYLGGVPSVERRAATELGMRPPKLEEVIWLEEILEEREKREKISASESGNPQE